MDTNRHELLLKDEVFQIVGCAMEKAVHGEVGLLNRHRKAEAHMVVWISIYPSAVAARRTACASKVEPAAATEDAVGVAVRTPWIGLS